jgi:hypothetical protein
MGAAMTLTSLALYTVARTRLGLSGRHFRLAVRRMLEAAGLAILFLGFNLVTGVFVILIWRLVAGGFVSLHGVNDIAWPAVSVLQALIFQWWRRL